MAKTSAQLNKQFAFITRAGAKLDAFIQETAIDTLEHFEEHKDARMVDRLYLALPKGARHAAMGEFILKHFAVAANTDPLTKKERPFLNAPDKVNDIEGAKADKWYDCKPSQAPDQLFDLQAAVRALLKKAAKSACMVGGSAESLKALAAAAGIPESDVPTVKVAESKEKAQAMLDAARDTLGLSA